MAIRQVEGNTFSQAFGNVASANIVLPFRPNKGNFIAVGVVIGSGSTITSVVDANGNAYTPTPASPATQGSVAAYTFYLRDAPASVSNTITITLNASNDCNAWAQEFTGVGILLSEATHTSATSSTNINDPTITPAIDGCLLWTTCAAGQSISVANSPWNGVGSPANGNYAEYYIQRKAAAQAIGFTQSPTGVWGAVETTFTPAPDLKVATLRITNDISDPVALGNNSGNAATLVITTGADALVGQNILLAVCAGTSAISSVVDAAGNTYTQDKTITNTIRTYLYRAKVTTQLSSGGTITITHTLGDPTSASAIAVSNIVNSLDSSNTNSGTSNNPTVTGTTVATRTLALTVVGWDSIFTLTPDGSNNWTPLTGRQQTGACLAWAYKKTNTFKSDQAYSATLSSSPAWGIIFATYATSGYTETVQIPEPIKADDENGWIEELTQLGSWFSPNFDIRGWFSPDFIGFSPSGSTTPQTLNATATSTSTVSKTTGKIAAATATSSSSLIKQARKILNATNTSTSVVAKQIAKKVDAVATSTSLVVKQARKILSAIATSTSTVTALKVFLKALNATVTSTGNMLRSTGKIVSAVGTTTSTAIKAVGKSLNATATSTSSLISAKVKLVVLNAIATTSSVLVKQGRKVLNATATSTSVLTRILALTKTLNATATTTSAINKVVAKALSAIATSTSILNTIKVKLVVLSATVTSTGNLVKQAQKKLSAVVTSASATTRTAVFLRILAATVTSTSSLRKVVTKALNAVATSTSVLNTIKVRLVNLSATVTSTASLFKSIQKRFSITITTVNALVVGGVFFKVLSATVTSSSAIIKQIGKVKSIVITTTSLLSKARAFVLDAIVNTSAQLTKRVGKRFDVVVTIASKLFASAFVILLPLGNQVIRAIEALRKLFGREELRVIKTVQEIRVLHTHEPLRLVRATEANRIVHAVEEPRVIRTHLYDDTRIAA